MPSTRSKKFYDLLGLKTTNPSEDELKKAYKKMAMKYHPDRNQEQPEAAEKKFKQISEAYETLKDPRKKTIYDQLGEEGLRNGGAGPSHPGPGHTTFSRTAGDPFAGFRGSGGSGRRPSSRAGRANPFADEFGAGRDPFDLFNEMMRDRHGREGGGPFAAGSRGRAGGGRFPADGSPQRRRSDFKAVVNNTLSCTLEQLYTGCTKKMKITKHVAGERVEKVLDIEVQSGWKKGTKITFVGEGDDPGDGGKAQDIVFTIDEKPHPYLKRDGDNLIYSAKVTAAQAKKGLKITVPQLDGRNVELQTRAGEIKSGSSKVIAGEGMPIRKAPGTFGIMIIRFEVTPG